MPILIYTTSQGPRGGILNSRVLIGRRISPALALDDNSVSRLHAWIDPVADERGDWVITDAGSKTGTLVNDQQITRHHLQDGDVIRVGKITLVYQEQESLPAGAEQVEFIAPPPVVRDDGILFECSCGAPLWVGSELAGKRGMCRHCRKPVTVPSLTPSLTAEAPRVDQAPAVVARTESASIIQEESLNPRRQSPAAEPLGSVLARETGIAVTAMPAAEPLGSVLARETAPGAETAAAARPNQSKRKSKCAVCHSEIAAGEEMTACPDCAMAYHAECWQENLGCSSYGCPQVNCLAPKTANKFPIEPAPIGDPAGIDQGPGTPWELVLFAASIVGSLLGALLFGSLAAIVALLSVVVLLRKKPVRSGLLLAAIAICVVGIAGGLVASDFYYFDARHLPAMLLNRL